MRSVISYMLYLIAFIHSGRCQTNATQISDTIFQKAVSSFKEKFSESIKESKFPTTKDSGIYVTNLFDLLNRELKTKVFDKKSRYSDFSFSTKSYDLTIHEILLAKIPGKFTKKVIKPNTEAPLQFEIRQFGNRVLLFSYPPFKLSDNLKQSIKSFENIYKELTKPAQ